MQGAGLPAGLSFGDAPHRSAQAMALFNMAELKAETSGMTHVEGGRSGHSCTVDRLILPRCHQPSTMCLACRNGLSIKNVPKGATVGLELTWVAINQGWSRRYAIRQDRPLFLERLSLLIGFVSLYQICFNKMILILGVAVLGCQPKLNPR